jgi:hypothetical protein
MKLKNAVKILIELRDKPAPSVTLTTKNLFGGSDPLADVIVVSHKNGSRKATADDVANAMLKIGSSAGEAAKAPHALSQVEQAVIPDFDGVDVYLNDLTISNEEN